MKKECKTCGYDLKGICCSDGKCSDYSAWYAKEDQYTENSVVVVKKDRVTALIDAHWNYLREVITIGGHSERLYTFDYMIKIREFEYKSAGKHFYGHGYEDAKNEKINL